MEKKTANLISATMILFENFRPNFTFHLTDLVVKDQNRVILSDDRDKIRK